MADRTGDLRRALRRLLRGDQAAAIPGGRAGRRAVRLRPRLETLEDRRLLAAATDLAAITGRVFDDATGDGFDPGEEVAGATLNLYRDDGDGTFEPADDTLLDTTTTDASGRYRFEDLTADTYFVEQPAQSADGSTLQQDVSPPITVSAADAQGELIRTIDSFDETTHSVVDTTDDGVPETSSEPAPEAIGGERDILVNKTSENGAVQISVNDPLLPGVLSFDSILNGQGTRAVSWDGPDGSAEEIDDTGLGDMGDLDLTSGGAASGFELQIGADQAGATAVVRVYSDDGDAGTSDRFSTVTIEIPDTGGLPEATEYVAFSDFTATSGGGADFTQVGAIEMEVSGDPNVNGSAELVGAVGPTVFTQDFDNFETVDLRLEKTADAEEPNVGETVTFTVTVTNDGPDTATGVVVTDQLPTGLTFLSADPEQGDYDAGTGVWTVGSLASGESATLSLEARADEAGTFTNTAEVTAADQFDPDSTPGNDDPEEDDQDSAVITTPVADLSLTKSVDEESPNVGDTVTFTVAVANAGPDAASGVTVVDALPEGTTFVSSDASQGEYDADTGVWTVGGLASGETATLEIAARIDSLGATTNTAEITAADQFDPDSTPGNDEAEEDDQDAVVVTPQAIDLALAKSVDEERPEVGDSVTYTLTLSNTGPDTATGVSVGDELPDGVSFVSAEPSQGTYDAGSNTWTVGSLASGVSATLDLVVEVESAGTQTNRAEVTSADQADVDSTPDNDDPAEDDQASASITPIAADLSLTKSVDEESPNVGDSVTYTITVSNAGPDDATGVSVREELGAGTTFVSANPNQGTYDSETGVWTIGGIASGESATLQLVATAEAAGEQTNTAEITAADQFDPDSTPDNDDPGEDDQDSVTIDPQLIDLALTKMLDEDEPDVGDEITYTLTLDNDGPSTATGVEVTDQLPTGVTFVSATASQGSYESETGVWTVGTVEVSALPTLEVVVRVGETTGATNAAEVTAADQPDVDSTPGNDEPAEDDQDSVSFTTRVADLELTKTVDNASPNRDESVEFTVTVRNDGPSDAEEVVVLDEVPSGFTLVAASESQGTYNSTTGRWTVGEIASGATATLTLTMTPTTSAGGTNAAEVVSVRQFDPDSTPGNNDPEEDDQDSVMVAPALIDLSVTAEVDNETPELGDTITLSFDVTNSGPDDASGVALRSQLPDGLTFVSASADQGTYDSATGVWTLGTLAAGETRTLQVVATVATRGIKTATVEVIAADQFDVDSTPDNDVEEEDDQASVAILAPRILSKRLFLAR